MEVLAANAGSPRALLFSNKLLEPLRGRDTSTFTFGLDNICFRSLTCESLNHSVLSAPDVEVLAASIGSARALLFSDKLLEPLRGRNTSRFTFGSGNICLKSLACESLSHFVLSAPDVRVLSAIAGSARALLSSDKLLKPLRGRNTFLFFAKLQESTAFTESVQNLVICTPRVKRSATIIGRMNIWLYSSELYAPIGSVMLDRDLSPFHAAQDPDSLQLELLL